MLPRSFVATAGLLVHIGASTPRTASVVTDPTDERPSWAKARRSRSRRAAATYRASRPPANSAARNASAQALKVTVFAVGALRAALAVLRWSAGSAPLPIFSRSERAALRAAGRVTVGNAPRPNSRRLSSTVMRSSQDLAPVAVTCRQRPVTPPTACVPGAAITATSAELSSRARTGNSSTRLPTHHHIEDSGVKGEGGASPSSRRESAPLHGPQHRSLPRWLEGLSARACRA